MVLGVPFLNWQLQSCYNSCEFIFGMNLHTHNQSSIWHMMTQISRSSLEVMGQNIKMLSNKISEKGGNILLLKNSGTFIYPLVAHFGGFMKEIQCS